MGIAIIPISIIDVDTHINAVESFNVFSNVIRNVYMLDYSHYESPITLVFGLKYCFCQYTHHLFVRRHGILFSLWVIRKVKHQIGQPLFKRGIVLELFKQFHIVCHDGNDDLLQGSFTFKPRTLHIGVLHGVFIFFILGYHCRDFKNLSADIIRIVPVDVSEHIVEVGKDHRKQIHLRLDNMADIVAGAQKMVDRVATFCEKNVEVGNAIARASKLFEENHQRLVEGRQSIVKAANEVIAAGVKLTPGKELPEASE